MKIDVNHPIYVMGFAAVFSAAFTAAVISLEVMAQPRIEQNEVLRLDRALVQVFKLGKVEELGREEVIRLVSEHVDSSLTVKDPKSGKSFQVFRAYKTKEKKELTGVGFFVSGTGFWAPIRGLMAVTPDVSRIEGIVFLDQQETPGLGGRITEPGFQEQFAGKKITTPGEGMKYIYIGGTAPSGPEDPRSGRYVDAITGATQTSLAVGKFMNEELGRFQRAWEAVRSEK